MKRRTLLKSSVPIIGTSFAGCLSQGTKISPLEYTVEIESEQTSDTPATLTFTLANTGEKLVEVGDSRDIFKFESDSFITKESSDIVEYDSEGEYWYDPSDTVRTTQFETLRLDSGQTITGTVYLLQKEDAQIETIPQLLELTSTIQTQTTLNGVDEGEDLNWTIELDTTQLGLN